jgi:molecular chaperone GrpE
LQNEKENKEEDEDEMKLVTTLKEKEEGLKQDKNLGKEKALVEEIAKLLRLLDEEKRRSEDFLTRLKYLQADFENYRKRVDREVQEIEDFSTSGLVQKLLPILDELELAIDAGEQNPENKSLLEGIKMIYKNLNAALEAEGLERIQAIGKPFNPALHEAVEKVQGTNTAEDIVIEEIRKGFIFKNRVLRPSMVKVESSARDQNKNDKMEGD